MASPAVAATNAPPDWAAERAELKERIAQLEQQVAWFQRQIFGEKSERRHLEPHTRADEPWRRAGPGARERTGAPSRAAIHVREGLGENVADGAVLVTDGYADYERYAERTGITHAQCWAHTRRTLERAKDVEPVAVAEALERIGELYACEAAIRAQNLAGESKRAYRLTHAKPVVDAFFDWAQAQLEHAGRGGAQHPAPRRPVAPTGGGAPEGGPIDGRSDHDRRGQTATLAGSVCLRSAPMRAVLIDSCQALIIAHSPMKTPAIAWRRGIGDALKTEFSFRHYIARQDVAVRHGVPAQRRDGRRIRRQIGPFIQRHANETETRVGGEIRLGFSDDEPPQRSTCRVSLRMRPLYTHPVVL